MTFVKPFFFASRCLHKCTRLLLLLFPSIDRKSESLRPDTYGGGGGVQSQTSALAGMAAASSYVNYAAAGPMGGGAEPGYSPGGTMGADGIEVRYTLDPTS